MSLPPKLLDGSQVRARRVALGLTVPALASQLGISIDVVRAIEVGAIGRVGSLPLDVLLRLTETLQLGFAKLFTTHARDPVAAPGDDDRAIEAALLTYGDTVTTDASPRRFAGHMAGWNGPCTRLTAGCRRPARGSAAPAGTVTASNPTTEPYLSAHGGFWTRPTISTLGSPRPRRPGCIYSRSTSPYPARDGNSTRACASSVSSSSSTATSHRSGSASTCATAFASTSRRSGRFHRIPRRAPSAEPGPQF
jgi:transcriptional regulator with XRE-family HTH domain